MGINISFFKTPKHRVFHYEPRYYDERREHRERVRQEALREKALAEGKEWKEDEYRPGQYISGKLQEEMHRNRKHSVSDNTMKLVGIISLLCLFVMLFFFGKYFLVLLESLR